MTKVAVQEPSKDVLRVAERLESLSFDLELHGSQRYVLRKLEEFSSKQLESLRGYLQQCGHPRFRKEFAISRHVPYGNSAEFRRCIGEADVLKLARLIRIVGMLLQAKDYLFWVSN